MNPSAESTMSDAATTNRTMPDEPPTATLVPPVAGRPPARVSVTWAGDHRFDAGRAGGPTIRLDASATTGPSPVDGLISALGACVSVDIVDILAKRRTPVSALRIDVSGARANAVPASLTSVQLDVHVDGEGIERVHAERAVELAVTKYCSVRDSLRADIDVRWTVVINGAAPDDAANG